MIVINVHILFIREIIFVLQFRGGSVFSIKIRWSQKILFHDGQLSLCVPFSFPSYVNPAGRNISKKEKIFLKVNSGATTEVLCKTTSHPFKVKKIYCVITKLSLASVRLELNIIFTTFQELLRQAGKLNLSYEAEVLTWSSTDLSFSYSVRPKHKILLKLF